MRIQYSGVGSEDSVFRIQDSGVRIQESGVRRLFLFILPTSPRNAHAVTTPLPHHPTSPSPHTPLPHHPITPSPHHPTPHTPLPSID
ncbi:hypothetical protein [Microcystis sp. LE19-41.2A]|uniref:hypothetical protein n=1 Tax=Microcystis sp. LE19-41.2A TaxID=3016427 RepID=UPI0025894F86|nr:hypothetical protein [Microcystis sp. LE19-41.2A]